MTKPSISFIHEVCDGDAGDFHLSNIKRLASRVTKATKAASREESDIVGGITPNSAVNALGSIGFPAILDSEWKIPNQ